jgi:hypothetical protein
MRKIFGLLLAVMLLAAACGDDDGGGNGTDPAAADTCEELADVGINMLQSAVDELDEMELDDFMAAASSDEMPPALQRMETLGEELEIRAEQLGCSEEEGQELLCERIDQLKADGEVGQLMLAGIAGEC